jgi:hypothetical protein
MNYTSFKHLFHLFLLSLLTPFVAYNQVAGCTDPLSANYNPLATVNDGSCSYNTTNYTPLIKVDPITDSLAESSGLQMAGDYLWSFNDRGGTATLYRIDTITNTLLQRVILEGATNTDWEDIAFDGTNLYIGDFGNNLNGARTNLKIYKFPLSVIPDYANNPVVTIPAQQIEVINFSYSDQPQPPAVVALNTTKYDCEAMIVDNGKIHLFSKNWVDNNSTHYVINSSSAGTYIALPVETLATNYLVSAADKVTGQNIVVLLGYQNSGTGSHFMHILSDYRADSFFTGNKRILNLPDATVMGQAEGISFRNGKYGYISNEKFVRTVGPFTFVVNQKLRAFDISSFTNDYFTQYNFTGNGNWSDNANWQYHLVPPSTLVPGNEIMIDPVAGGTCTLDIPFTLSAGTKLSVKNGKNFLVKGNLVVQ